ncbi:Integrase, catalytic core [Cucumis melo var. makuwa]|uniref:Integrase, catalytic core n=1 Tax=Cucumis melo var. makuwa TaxID=1194695 RepID=A0A5A7SNK1_CUCMM|nr:Integrase, catalytic core [Cucumis melo var. makuwa]TYK30765.1 Integrase, catalytic core [Cucumis melo var. makuwa]
MFSRLSFFPSSLSSPHPFFTNTFVNLFPPFEATLDTELTQSAHALANSNQSFVFNDIPEPTLDTTLRHSTRALEKTHTWDYVDLPPGRRLIRCKWIYKIKTHSYGTIKRYKARLVAKGYSQGYDIDYEETFAHVARMISAQSLLAVVAVKQWPLLQMDVKNVFLNGTLSEEVYMKPPLVLLLILIRCSFYTEHMAIFNLQYYLGQNFEMKGITYSNTASTPLDPSVHLTPFNGVPLEDKQSVVSHSNTESKYRALADTIAELIWLHWLLADMGVP